VTPRARAAALAAVAAMAVTLALATTGCGSADSSTTTHAPRPIAAVGAQPTARSRVSGTSAGTRRSTASARAPARANARPSPALAPLRAALTSQLAAAGPQTGALVYDLDTHQQLFALRAGAGRPPASVEKLYTSVAVLDALGPGDRFQTSVLGAGHAGAHGVWHGDLYLRGGGDPSFGDGTFNRVWEQGHGPTAQQLVGQLQADGIRRVTGRVIGDASLFDFRPGPPSSGYAPDLGDLGGQLSALTYDHGMALGGLGPAAFAARELVLTMRRSGIRARAATITAVAPPYSQPLATVNSPPASVLLKLTDVPSDDLFAEMLTKQLGARVGTGGTTAAGAAVIASSVAQLGVHPRIVDGSGLSRADRSSPTEVVALLRGVWGTPTGDVLRASLPVVGVDGTTQQIGVGTAAQGRCTAKTGTLNYVTNLAGYCHTRDGDTLAFAILLDGPTNFEGVMTESRMVAAIARY
jgi:D-alanyl-D-alanine carboxypeptidase/D-alanyl-D-alanine-endopeptidase (penicillin-binding protein 4)